MSDEIREFHLDGKQLAFLVISAIGVSVVVFLCGVMVGRGVRTSPSEGRLESTLQPSTADAAPLDVALPENLPVATDGRTLIPSKEALAYSERAPGATPSPARDPLPAAPRSASPSNAPEPGKAASHDASTTTTKPPATPATRYVVQVSSGLTHAQAEDGKRYLAAKGFKAYSERSNKKYRLRAGPFDTHQEAKAALDRMKKDTKYKTFWLTTP
jgi:cell division protein FtsN